MADLLLELCSEEIPARMQTRAAADLMRLVTSALTEAGVIYEAARAFATPRRLALVIDGLPASQPDRKEERKGPRVGAPDKAIEGFLRGAGVASIEECETREDKKGAYYVAVIEQKGRATAELIAEIVPEVVRAFPWPKSMRWGAGSLRWVRPLQSILCTLDGEVVPFEIDGLRSGNATIGHRFMADGPIANVLRYDDYVERLERAHVRLDTEDRKRHIHEDAKNLTFAEGLELVEDEALLNEVAGLVEWPVVLMGSFDEAFLDLPEEVLVAVKRNHQKYFSVRDPNTAKLAARFIAVANLEADDGGAAIRAGNERVLTARLSDAKFFWDQDRKQTLETRLPKLQDIVFHEKLGTVAQKVERVRLLAGELAGKIGAEREKAMRAAQLCKADLVSDMVYEFPEVQGIMGRYYALLDGEDGAVANAIRDHYAPQGPDDDVPAEATSIAVALADKLDTLAGFWLIGEKPTGSKDPYALRRAALGIIRMVLENDLRLPLLGQFDMAAGLYGDLARKGSQSDDLLAFFADRLKVHLRDKGARHDLVDAVFALEGEDDLALIVARVEALAAFLATDDGANLLAAFKRAANILRIEEKKDGASHRGHADPALFAEGAEQTLFDRLAEAAAEAEAAVAREDFTGAMAAMARLRAPVDAFFDRVTVNADDPAVRANRLRLLSQIVTATRSVADFSRIEG